MNTRQNILGAAICLSVLSLGGPSVHAQNLLTDPGFEGQVTAPNPNPTGIPGWANFGASFSQTYVHSGSWSLYTPAGAGGYSVPGSYQDFAASPGQTFTLSGWIYTPNALVTGANDFALLQLSFYTGAPPNNYATGTAVNTFGVDVGDPGGTPPANTVALPQGVWTFASITGTAGAGVNSVGAYLLDINADANANFYFDDMTLTASAVPEPSSLALAGLGALGFFGMLRRRK